MALVSFFLENSLHEARRKPSTSVKTEYRSEARSGEVQKKTENYLYINLLFPTMNKLMIILITLILVSILILIGCNNKKEITENQVVLKKIGELCNRSYECEKGLECYPFDGGKCIKECPAGYQRYNETVCMVGV